MAPKVSVDEAVELLKREIQALEFEQIPLAQAPGRVLQQSVYADRDLPPFDRVMMDGIAIKYEKGDRSSWTVKDTQYAGDEVTSLDNPTQCIEIMTGAMMPQGADTIIPVEDYDLNQQQVVLNKGVVVKKGQFIHEQGSVSKADDLLVEKNQLLDGRLLGLCSSVGLTNLVVSRQPRVAFISTGNELVASWDNPNATQLRRTNDQFVISELKKFGLELTENLHLCDDRELILKHLNHLQEYCDLIIFSGGVSKGKADFIPTCVWEAGFELIYHGIVQKPGGPMLAARNNSGTVILGLPGNPMSSMVCTRIYLRLVLEQFGGYPLRKRKIALNEDISGDWPKSKLLPVKIVESETDGVYGEIVYPKTSGDLLTVLQSDGVVYLPKGQKAEKGTLFDYFDWAL